MSGETTNPKSGRRAKTLDEEIAAQREELRKLKERQREQQYRERERSQKTVMEPTKTEWFDTIPSDLWRKATPKIKVLLVVDTAKPAEPVTSVQTVPEVAAAAEVSQRAFSTDSQAPVPSTGGTRVSQRERITPGFLRETSCGKLEKREGLWGL